MMGLGKRCLRLGQSLVLGGCLVAVYAVAAQAQEGGGSVGSRLYVTDEPSASVAVIDPARRSLVTAVVPVGEGPVIARTSPDGQKLYVLNHDSRTVSVIATAAQQVIATIAVEGEPIDLAPSRDGKRIYVAGRPADGSPADRVMMTDAVTYQSAAPLRLPARVRSIDVSSDGRQLWVAYSSSSTVAAINLSNGKVAGSVRVRGQAEDVAVSADGQRVYVSDSLDDSVVLIDAGRRKAIARVPVGNFPRTVLESPDGRQLWVANRDDSSVMRIDLVTRKVTGAVFRVGRDVQDLAISRDGRQLWVASRDGVLVIDTGALQAAAWRGDPGATSLAVTPDGARLYIAYGMENVVWAVNTSGDDPVLSHTFVGSSFEHIDNFLDTYEGLRALAVSPDGQQVYVVDEQGNTIRELNTVTGKVRLLERTGSQTHLELSPDGRLYIASSGRFGLPNTAEVFSLPDGPSKDIQGVFADSVAVSRDGQRLYWFDTFSGEVTVTDAASLAVLAMGTVGLRLIDESVSPDGRFLWVAGTEDANGALVAAIDTQSLQVVARVPLSGRPISLAVSPDGGRVSVATREAENASSPRGYVTFIDAATRQVTSRVRVGGAPWDLLASPDGRQVYAICSASVWVVDIASQQALPVPVGRGLRAGALKP